MATASLLTLVANDAATLFPWRSSECVGPEAISPFCWIGSPSADVVRWVYVALLCVVASGWRPRLTGILHWWISFSIAASGRTLDGGDLLASHLSLLLIPVTLTDGRVWHWCRNWRADGNPSTWHFAIQAISLSSLVALRVQMAIVYFQAAFWKLRLEVWRNGTAAYYWFLDPTYGLPEYFRPAAQPIVLSIVGTAYLSWLTLVIEFWLFTGLVMKESLRRWAFLAGLLLHGTIAILLGLPTFSLIMIAGLTLYLFPLEWRTPSSDDARIEGIGNVAASGVREKTASAA